MRKKTLTVLVTAGLLLSMLILSLSSANAQVLPHSPSTDKPIITFYTSQTNTTDDVTINFSITKPESWFWEIPGGKLLVNTGTVTKVTCTLDQSLILYNDTPYGYATGDLYGFYVNRVRNYTVAVGSLSLGPHTVEVSVDAYTTYAVSASLPDDYYDVSTNATCTFTVAQIQTLPPSPAIPEFPLTTLTLTFLTITVIAGVFFRKKQL
jgi:hypothetical protein